MSELICYCIATKEIVRQYNSVYRWKGSGQPLAVIYSLSAYGRRSLTICNRLLYQRIGITDGWSVSHSPTLLLAK